MKKQVVVSRYNENLEWLSDFDINTIVYNKYDTGMSKRIRFKVHFSQKKPIVIQEKVEVDEAKKPNFDLKSYRSNIECIHLFNDSSGREAHTYLWHIVNNYHKLADVTFFLQGNPLFHCSHIVNMLNCEYTKPTTLTSRYDDRLIGHQSDLIKTACGHEVRYGDGKFHPQIRKLAPAWCELFPDAIMPTPFYFGYAAMWAVPKQYIISRKLDFYQYMLGRVSDINGWVFEMLWNYIFNNIEEYPDFMGPPPKKIRIF